MRLVSKVAPMIACAAATAFGVGCNPATVSQAHGVAYVKLDDVVQRDPMYPQLQKIDDAIAMVELVGASPRVPRSAAEVAKESAQLRSEIAAAQQRTQRIIAQKQEEYSARARAAVTAALAAAGVKGAGNVAQTMGAVSAQQAQQAQMQAGRDLMAYRQTVVQQSNTAAQSIVRQLQAEASQKLQAKAQQEQQAESNLALRLSQQDAQQKLAIQTRLSMLALGQSERQQLQSQLSQMQAREDAAVAAQRAADQRAYNAYRAQLTAQTNAAVRAQIASIQTQTQAKLNGRRNAVVAQLRAMTPAQSGTVSPATRAQIQKIGQQFQDQYQRDVQQVLSQYQQTEAALEVQYAQLNGADAAASAASQQEVAMLQQQRSTLYDQIVAHVQSEAARFAKQKGFDVVFSDIDGAAGAYDLTNDLISYIESEHQ